MTKNEIQFLIESGFELNEIIAMGTSAPETPPAAEDPAPIDTSAEEPAAPADEVEQQEQPAHVDTGEVTELKSTISELQKEIKKLGDRIAAQGIARGTFENPLETLDDSLAKIAKKLNGGKK